MQAVDGHLRKFFSGITSELEYINLFELASVNK